MQFLLEMYNEASESDNSTVMCKRATHGMPLHTIRPLLAGRGNTAAPWLSSRTPAWPSASDSYGDCLRNRI